MFSYESIAHVKLDHNTKARVKPEEQMTSQK